MPYLYFICSFFIAAYSGHSHGKEYGNVANVLLVSVYDGDTFRANIVGWPQIIGENTPIRIKGVDTPELRGKCPQEKHLAKKAKLFSQQQLEQAQRIELRNIGRGKYFRLLADVYVDGNNLALLLTKAGYGYTYQGGKRRSWC
ncbi:thermonuclease family protein [Thalassotalea maritima]|uniref:thermonuclease family protein n=1 Tax=Thalassotalea maritima TaxID=3242416 RepID=UPI00352823CD